MKAVKATLHSVCESSGWMLGFSHTLSLFCKASWIVLLLKFPFGDKFLTGNLSP